MNLHRFSIPPNRTRWLLALLLAALIVSLLEAFYISQPGTMDACYYYSGGLNIFQGRGMNEYFYWNYLEGSGALPHPGFLYWMPLTSFVAASGMFLLQDGFRQAQIPFLLLSLAFPLWVYWLGFKLTASFRMSIVAGFLSIFSGFYAIYWLNTESFLLFAWIGSLTFYCLSVLLEEPRWYLSIVTGILCGLAHLTRADGILLVPLACLAILVACPVPWLRRAKYILGAIAGYILTSGFWYLRNLRTLGNLLPTATGNALWLTAYNDLFHIPASDLTPERFFSGGLLPLIAVRGTAILWNTESAIFVLGMIFLFPIICWGAYLLRKRPVMAIGIGYFFLLFFVMSIVYPFQGSRGGFFHSTAALLPLAAVAASLGLDKIIARLGKVRNWRIESAQTFFGIGFVLLALVSTGVIFYQRVIGSDPNGSYWSTLNADYSAGVRRLGDVPPGSLFMVNNPPCFYTQTGMQAIPIPDGDPDTLLSAADRYGARYVILDSNVPDGLLPLYQQAVSVPRLQKVWEDRRNGVAYIWFLINPPPQPP
jgi:4-amino-4-deoxy-L-arabinose transferase-like glycosyltransferase